MQALRHIVQPPDLTRIDQMLLFYIASACSSALQKTSDWYKWKVCDRFLWAFEVPDEGLGHLITVKNIGGLGFPSPAMYSLAMITLTVYLDTKHHNLFSADSKGNLIALMITVTKQRLQLEPLNSLRNVFDCSSNYDRSCR